MKKIIKFIRFCTISSVIFGLYAAVASIFFKMIWGFRLFAPEPYVKLYSFWEKGGVFKEVKDISLVASLIALPVCSLISGYKMYKKGFWKTILSMFSHIYRRCTRPKNMEVEHVAIKNLGSKSRTLDEIISDKMKEKGETLTQEVTSLSLRQQVSAKVEENKIQ